jgi:hypothetical protein
MSNSNDDTLGLLAKKAVTDQARRDLGYETHEAALAVGEYAKVFDRADVIAADPELTRAAINAYNERLKSKPITAQAERGGVAGNSFNR